MPNLLAADGQPGRMPLSVMFILLAALTAGNYMVFIVMDIMCRYVLPKNVEPLPRSFQFALWLVVWFVVVLVLSVERFWRYFLNAIYPQAVEAIDDMEMEEEAASDPAAVFDPDEVFDDTETVEAAESDPAAVPGPPAAFESVVDDMPNETADAATAGRSPDDRAFTAAVLV